MELLIGTNAPKLMEPWEIINSQGKGPYAVRTLLGWVVNGPLRGGEPRKGKKGHPEVTVNRISVAKLQDLLVSQYNQDFNEKSDHVCLSREDQRFMQIMESSIQLDEGHYCFDLPFKARDVILPNNCSIAKQRLLSLHRKFKRNKDYHQESQLSSPKSLKRVMLSLYHISS